MNVVMSLLPSHDALLLQEVHGTSGMLEAWSRPRGYQAFFSLGANAGCAGVGILLSESFLQNFEGAPQVTEVCKGRALKVSLRGRKGCLDIWSVYFPTGDAITANDLYDVPLRDQLNCRHFVDLRNLMRNRMRASLSSSLEAASVVGWGFNYVIDSGDRRALNTMAETGSRNRSEEDHWQKRVARPFNLVEMQQESMTHQSARSQSRLDRMYTNFPIIDQLDKSLRMVALAWQLPLSAHRPISFRRCTAAKKPSDGVSQAALKHKDFPRRVRLAYLDLLRSDPDADAIDRYDFV